MMDQQHTTEFTMLDLFRQEVEAQVVVFNEGFLNLKTQPQSSQTLESLMEATQMIKGVAQIVEVEAAVNLTNIIQDYVIALQNQNIALGETEIDVLRLGVDTILDISQVEEVDLDRWLSEHQQEILKTGQAITNLPRKTQEKRGITAEVPPTSPPPPPSPSSPHLPHLPQLQKRK